MFREAFETIALDDRTIDQTIAAIYSPERKDRQTKEPELVNQLYRLDVFDWGGLSSEIKRPLIFRRDTSKTIVRNQASDRKSHSSNSGLAITLCRSARTILRVGCSQTCGTKRAITPQSMGRS